MLAGWVLTTGVVAVLTGLIKREYHAGLAVPPTRTAHSVILAVIPPATTQTERPVTGRTRHRT
jgi:hypothetical protein